MKKHQFSLTTFGLRLREHRQERRLTIGDLSDQLGVLPSEMAAVEVGEVTPTPDYVARVASLMNLTLQETTELFRLSLGKRNGPSLQFYRDRKQLHERSARAMLNLHQWKPSLIRRLEQYCRGSLHGQI